MKTAILLASLALAASGLQAEVLDSAASGFTVKTSLLIAATPDEVYRGFVRNVGDWWNKVHTYTGDAHNLSIDDRPMGCFCENLPGGGGVRHMEVVYASPWRLVMLGALGPLQTEAATGSLTIEITYAGRKAKLTATYAVSGYRAGGMAQWAAPVDSVLTEQMTRLRNLLEKRPLTAK